MMRYSHQRLAGLTLFAGLSAAMVLAARRYAGIMPRLPFLTGWILFTLMVLLAFYNGRKKLPFLPLFSSETWLQIHIYAGLLTGTLFLIHVNYRIPAGLFNGILAGVYALVMLSGILGLFISRDIPKRLTTRGGEVLFERIPVIRRQLREQTEQLALASVSQARAGTIADFYHRELSQFFESAQNPVSHLLQRRRPLNNLQMKIGDLSRYLNAEERATMQQIADLVNQKDGLDYHYAHQLLLKLWLFVHIPLTYSVLILTLAHIVIVFAFSGGAR